MGNEYYDQDLFAAIERILDRLAAVEATVARMSGKRDLGTSTLFGAPQSALPDAVEIGPNYDVDVRGDIYQIYVQRQEGRRPKVYVRYRGRARGGTIPSLGEG